MNKELLEKLCNQLREEREEEKEKIKVIHKDLDNKIWDLTIKTCNELKPLTKLGLRKFMGSWKNANVLVECNPYDNYLQIFRQGDCIYFSPNFTRNSIEKKERIVDYLERFLNGGIYDYIEDILSNYNQETKEIRK